MPALTNLCLKKTLLMYTASEGVGICPGPLSTNYVNISITTPWCSLPFNFPLDYVPAVPTLSIPSFHILLTQSTQILA